MRTLGLVLGLAVAWTVMPAKATAAPMTEVVVVTGDAGPTDGSFSFIDVDNLGLNDLGQVAFEASLTGTVQSPLDRDGIFVGNGSDALSQIVREYDLAPSPAPADSRFLQFGNDVSLNNDGQVAFTAALSNAGAQDQGVFVRNLVGGAPVMTARMLADDDVPGSGKVSDLKDLTLNENGSVAFYAELYDTDGGSGVDEHVLLRADSATSTTTLARRGQAPPDGDGAFHHFRANADFNFVRQPKFNDAGQAAFLVSLRNTSRSLAIYVGDASGSLTEIAREGDAVDLDPINTTVDDLSEPVINDHGQVAFAVDAPGSLSGLFLGEALTLISAENSPAPGGGTFEQFTGAADINNARQVLFTNTLNNFSGPQHGLYRYDDDTSTIIPIALDGQAVPNGGVITGVLYGQMNDAGQVVFETDVYVSGQGTLEVMFLYDDEMGLVEIAREDEAMLGSTISDLHNFENAYRLNEAGQVAYGFRLADGRSGVALWSIPEPTSLALLAIGGVALVRRRRRRAVEP